MRLSILVRSVGGVVSYVVCTRILVAKGTRARRPAGSRQGVAGNCCGFVIVAGNPFGEIDDGGGAWGGS